MHTQIHAYHIHDGINSLQDVFFKDFAKAFAKLTCLGCPPRSVAGHLFAYSFVCMRIYACKHVSYVFVYVYACHIHPYTHTCTRTAATSLQSKHEESENVHMCMHTYIHHTYIHMCMHAYIHKTYMHTCPPHNTHQESEYIHICVHACIHTYIHTHTCVQLQPLCPRGREIGAGPSEQ